MDCIECGTSTAMILLLANKYPAPVCIHCLRHGRYTLPISRAIAKPPFRLVPVHIPRSLSAPLL